MRWRVWRSCRNQKKLLKKQNCFGNYDRIWCLQNKSENHMISHLMLVRVIWTPFHIHGRSERSSYLSNSTWASQDLNLCQQLHANNNVQSKSPNNAWTFYERVHFVRRLWRKFPDLTQPHSTKIICRISDSISGYDPSTLPWIRHTLISAWQ